MSVSRLGIWYRSVLLLMIALWLASCGDLRAQMYEVTDLGTLGGPQPLGLSVATGLNDLGQVVGYSTANNDFTNIHAFLWENGIMTDLGPVGFGRPTGINDLGQVIIDSFSATTGEQASVWRRGTLTLPGLGGTSTFAAAINNLGRIVGNASTAGNAEFLAAIWFFPLPASRLAETVAPLGPNTIGGTQSAANAISDNGHIVGSGELAAIDPTIGFPAFHAVAWVSGNMTDLGTLRGTNSVATGVNFSDQITGWSQTTTLDPTYGVPLVHGFIVQNGVMTDLGTFNSQLALSFLANSINRHGQIVGDIAVQNSAYPLSWTLTGGFLWQNGTITDLAKLIPNPPGLLSSAAAINSRGQIAASTSGLTGAIHAVLLTPVSGSTASPATAIEPLATPQPVHRLVKKRSPEGRMEITVE